MGNRLLNARDINNGTKFATLADDPSNCIPG